MSADTELPIHAIDMIKSWIGRRDMNKSELARRLGVSHTWVSNRLAGSQGITLEELVKIARALDIEVEELLPKTAPTEAHRSGGLSPGSARVPSQPRTARLMEVAHRSGHAPPSPNRTNSDADNTAPIRHSRAPVRLCAGVTR